MQSGVLRRWFVLAAAVALAGAALPSAAPGTTTAADLPGTITSKVLVEGAPIHGANGLAIDHDGRLLVASVFGHELVALDPSTGKILERIGPVVDGVDAGGPDDVAVAPDGSICWTDFAAGFVDCLRPDSSVDRQFVAPGVNPIAFTDDGRLFVALAFIGDTLYELDPDLVDSPRVVMSGSGIPPFPDQLNGFDFGPDGLLYAPRPFSGQIGRIDVDAASPTFGLVSNAIASSVEFDPAGNLYASLPVTGEVARIDTTTGALTHVAWTRPNMDNMAFDPGGNLYVSGGYAGWVFRILEGGHARQLAASGLVLPGGVAAVGGGAGGADRFFVANLGSLVEHSGRTGRLTSIDENVPIGPSVTLPWTVAPDGDHVILTTWMQGMTGRVQIWDPGADVQIAAWDDFLFPTNAIRFGDDLVVAELGTGSVVRQPPGGVRSTIASGLFVPSGLAATGDDLWVTDWASGIVWQIVTNDSPSMTPVASGLAHPEGVAVDHDGSLLVVESGAGRLMRILPSGDTVVLADGLPLGAPAEPGTPAPAWAHNGVAVGPSGAIYLTTDNPSAIWRFVEAPR